MKLKVEMIFKFTNLIKTKKSTIIVISGVFGSIKNSARMTIANLHFYS